ncbi:MAG: hypothetical protein NTW16_00780 [Bacteroidetes bacterium]|nr:hypothetical protein [Bacteroidota bacterium]
MLHEVINTAHITELLLSLILVSIGAIIGMAAYFGRKYMQITETNSESLVKMGASLEFLVKASTDQGAHIENHGNRITTIETRCKIFHHEK